MQQLGDFGLEGMGLFGHSFNQQKPAALASRDSEIGLPGCFSRARLRQEKRT
jgi:hypothetical protein